MTEEQWEQLSEIPCIPDPDGWDRGHYFINDGEVTVCVYCGLPAED